MKRGQVFVRGRRRDGSIGNFDALDLDDASFRAFVLDLFVRCEIVVSVKDEFAEGERIKYAERKDPE